MTSKVVVIGAGISGLATADALVHHGYDVTVLERQAQVGGNAISERFDGFLMEHGPSTLNAAFPAVLARVANLGLDAATVDLGQGVRKRYLRDRGQLHGISVNPLGFFLSGYLSLRARMSIAGEIFRCPKLGTEEETIHAFVSRRFGAEFADKVIEPLAAGIFMGDAQELSISGAFPKLVEMEQRFGSIMRGVIAAKRGTEPGRRLFSWPGGIAELPRAYARRLSERIKTCITVLRISQTGFGFRIETSNKGSIQADVVVLAVQPHVAAALIENLDPEGAGALADIPAPPVAVVFLGYERNQVAHPLDGLGFLSTKGGDQITSGAQFASTMFPDRAPEGHVSIAAYVGGARNPEMAGLPHQDCVASVHSELSGLLGISGSPVVQRTRHWPRGLPHYTLGHSRRRGVLETISQREPGLYLTGNYLSGVSVAGCIEQANVTVEAIMLEAPPVARTASANRMSTT